jgi:surface antigen
MSIQMDKSTCRARRGGNAPSGGNRRAGSTWLLLSLAAVALALLPATAAAAPLWSSTPSPFACAGPGGSPVGSNSCLRGTGFNPNVKYWGQVTNPKGNCTNYVAYRLQRNGASQLASSFGNAVGWKGVVRDKLGSGAVNKTPKVGSIAWWGAYSASGIRAAGHVAYVEKISDNGRTVYLSESHFDRGSRRLMVRSSDGYWPDYFLHIKDRPKTPASAPSSPPSSAPSSPPSTQAPTPGSGGSTTDKTRPSAPTSPTSSARTTSTITLSWGKASDNVGVTGYSVYRNGSRIANSSSSSYKFSSLSCGTTYKLGVDAYDAAGNRSSVASVSASTAACPKKVSVSKGARVNVSGCRSSACAYVTVNLSNFGSGSHTVTCYSDYPPPTGAYYQYTTSSTTSDVCVYGYAGTHVWVKVDGVESNHLTW